MKESSTSTTNKKKTKALLQRYQLRTASKQDVLTFPQAIAWAAAAAAFGVVVTATFASQIIRSYALRPIVDHSTPMIRAPILIQVNDETSEQSVSDLQTVATDDSNKYGPAVALLLSFPNSGTSYTLHMVREASNHTTATNYALEGEIKDEPSIPIYGNAPSAENGPFMELIPNVSTIFPSKYILTKTHCGGFCVDCRPVDYIETPHSFTTSCLTGLRAFYDDKGKLTTEIVTYDKVNVQKAVHVVRHPLDNIVARFHLEFNRGSEHWQAAHPYNRTGFRKWCHSNDKQSRLLQQRYIDKDLSILLRDIPCHEELFRYIQWHNLAFLTTQELNIPVHMIRYQDYSTRHEEMMLGLLEFLELPNTGKVEPFQKGKEYRGYFTKAERAIILRFAQEYASPQTWEYIKEYCISD
mmetsp:Transcript_40236/g.56658  ORF Transcript_40236/g.56658 Transcript_40236/m.56658 type:complete len:411 (+) Transcript_40236:509-1741(+)